MSQNLHITYQYIFPHVRAYKAIRNGASISGEDNVHSVPSDRIRFGAIPDQPGRPDTTWRRQRKIVALLQALSVSFVSGSVVVLVYQLQLLVDIGRALQLAFEIIFISIKRRNRTGDLLSSPGKFNQVSRLNNSSIMVIRTRVTDTYI